MTFDQYAPYGPVVETTLRVVTWNVWGRYGQWQARQAGIEEALLATRPDIVLTRAPARTEPRLVAAWSATRSRKRRITLEP